MRVLVSREQIALRVRELGQHIADDVRRDMRRDGHDDAQGEVVLIPILTGAIVFVADLIREMPLKMSLRLVAVSSYPGTSMQSKGAILRSELPSDLRGRHVLIIDDILDNGQTLGTVRDLILEQRPASLRICVLLRKAVPKRVGDVVLQPRGEELGADVVGEGLGRAAGIQVGFLTTIETLCEQLDEREPDHDEIAVHRRRR